jgi:hypothetical protein
MFQICSNVICDVVRATAIQSHSSLLVYPTRSNCWYQCRDSPLALWQCGATAAASSRDVGVWFVWHGDSIARRTFVDVFETVAARLVFDLAALDRFCRRFDLVHDHRKCVLYDVVLQLPDKQHRLIRLTFVAKHRVADTFDWRALQHFEGRAWRAPALLVVNSGLWDLLYERNVTAYNANLPLAIDHALAARAAAVVWMAIPALDADHLPDWKRPFLTESAIRAYNEHTLAVVRRAPRTIRWLDTFALCDFATALTYGRLPLVGALQQAELFKTADGIHRPGSISKTITQLQFELTCGAERHEIAAPEDEPGASVAPNVQIDDRAPRSTTLSALDAAASAAVATTTTTATADETVSD